jgi:predicted RNase H-like nuclease (RuvC/YqgF family)
MNWKIKECYLYNLYRKLFSNTKYELQNKIEELEFELNELDIKYNSEIWLNTKLEIKIDNLKKKIKNLEKELKDN